MHSCIHKDYTKFALPHAEKLNFILDSYYEGWNFNSGNYLFTTDTK